MKFRQAVEKALQKHFEKIRDINGFFFLAENSGQKTRVFNCWAGNGLFCISIGIKSHLSTILRSKKMEWVIKQMDWYLEKFTEHVDALFDDEMKKYL